MKCNILGCLVLSASLALVGCGSKEESNKPVSQKKIGSFKETLKEVSKTYSSLGIDLTSDKKLGAVRMERVAYQERSGFDILAEKIGDGLDDGSCEFERKEITPISKSAKLSGNTCAATAFGKYDLNPAALELQFRYQIQDQEVLRKIDADALTIRLFGTVDAGTHAYDLALAGGIHSQNFGTLDWNGTLKFAGNGDSKIKFDFDYLGEEIKIEVNTTGATKQYKLDGREVSKEEVIEAVVLIGNLLEAIGITG
jgi:hypothetical protein